MPANVFEDETLVVPMLTRMMLPRWILLEMATKIGGERANVAPNEPPQVAGFETWRWGTRFFREDLALKELGWIQCDENQVSGIRNERIDIKLVVCSTNANTGNSLKAPKNISIKGPASCRLIDANNGQGTFGFLPINDPPSCELWYYCIHLSERYISIELSRPTLQLGGIITDFSDRIIVARPGEIPGIRMIDVPEDFADLPKPQVSRR
jgi:hypothetical protein